VILIKIVKGKSYLKDYDRKIKKKHLTNEEIRIKLIENLIIVSANMKELINSPLSKIYKIEKKNGVLKEIYTARINGKMRLYIKPHGDYPYELELITEVEFLEIDDKHYGDG